MFNQNNYTMKIKILAMVAMIPLIAASCTKPIKSFTATNSDGITYQYDVIVPLMHYVRIKPLTDPSQLSGAVVIPSTVEYDDTRFVITQIAEEAFEDCTGITQITLPATVSAIEDEAFNGCTALSQINTPQPLSTIGDEAFKNCVSLTEFSLEASISTLGEECFAGCTSLTDITLPTSLNSVPDKAFYGCSSVQSIFISSTVGAIGAEAFAGCSNVAQMTCMAGMPPTASENTFNGINPTIPVTVPMGGLSYYQTATGWNHFTNYNGVY